MFIVSSVSGKVNFSSILWLFNLHVVSVGRNCTLFMIYLANRKLTCQLICRYVRLLFSTFFFMLSFLQLSNVVEYISEIISKLHHSLVLWTSYWRSVVCVIWIVFIPLFICFVYLVSVLSVMIHEEERICEVGLLQKYEERSRAHNNREEEYYIICIGRLRLCEFSPCIPLEYIRVHIKGWLYSVVLVTVGWFSRRSLCVPTGPCNLATFLTSSFTPIQSSDNATTSGQNIFCATQQTKRFQV